VSYRSYRLVDRSQRYNPSVTAKLAAFVKRLKHAIEEMFGGEEPIEVLQFLRSVAPHPFPRRPGNVPGSLKFTE
jgi:hypothetical protein